MSDLEFLERQAREIKDMGYSSKFMIPINQFLEIAEKARKYDEMPAHFREIVEDFRAGK